MSKHQALNTFGRSGNPAFSRNFSNTAGSIPLAERMTLDGAVNKTSILLGLCFGGAYIGWNVPQLMWVGFITGFVLALVTIFRNPSKSGATAPLYAIAQGIGLGGVSMIANSAFPGIVIQALGLTFGITASLLFLYKSGLVKPTENFRLMIFSATGGIAILYTVSYTHLTLPTILRV